MVVQLSNVGLAWSEALVCQKKCDVLAKISQRGAGQEIVINGPRCTEVDLCARPKNCSR